MSGSMWMRTENSAETSSGMVWKKGIRGDTGAGRRRCCDDGSACETSGAGGVQEEKINVGPTARGLAQARTLARCSCNKNGKFHHFSA